MKISFDRELLWFKYKRIVIDTTERDCKKGIVKAMSLLYESVSSIVKPMPIIAVIKESPPTINA